MGLSMMDAVKLLRVPEPDYIKMDFDGIVKDSVEAKSMGYENLFL
jgi:hypothetical protein